MVVLCVGRQAYQLFVVSVQGVLRALTRSLVSYIIVPLVTTKKIADMQLQVTSKCTCTTGAGFYFVGPYKQLYM
jgi:hypothetical protein